MPRIRPIAVVLAALCALPMSAFAAPSRQDAAFVSDAAAIEKGQQQLGTMALRRAGSARVRAYATRILHDYQIANSQLASLAQSDRLALMQTPNRSLQDMEYSLDQRSGRDFDRRFLGEEQQADRQAIAVFAREATGGADPHLRRYAASTLPILRSHTAMVTSDIAQLSGRAASHPAIRGNGAP